MAKSDNYDAIDATSKRKISSQGLAESWRNCTYWWATCLMIFSIVIVMHGIKEQWNNPPWGQGGSYPGLEIVLFILMLTWIALLEGCQISIVGLQNVNMELYKVSHPRAYAICKRAHTGPNVERFLVGRQFLLLFNGFLASRLGGAKHPDFAMGDWEWGDEANQFFWQNSVLLMIVIIGPCQLVSQLIAADKMMEFLNLRFYGYYTVLLPCLFVESLGFTHSAYFLKDVLAKVAGIDTSTENPAKRMNKNFFYQIRVLFSISAVIFSGIFLVKGWATGQTNATQGSGWRKLPGGAAIVVGCFFLFVMACAEGIQVSALVLMKTKTTDFKDTDPLAYATTSLLFKGRNMQAFLVGRQFFVAMMMVLLGRVTSYAGGGGVLVSGDGSMCNATDVDGSGIDGSGMNATAGSVPCPGDDWGMGAVFNEWLLQTGFMGAIFVVNVAQLASQVTASLFPIGFINNRFMNWMLRVMLFVEASGLVNACWPLAWGLDWLLSIPEDPDFDAGKTKDDAKTPGGAYMDRLESMQMALPEGSTGVFDMYQDVAKHTTTPGAASEKDSTMVTVV